MCHSGAASPYVPSKVTVLKTRVRDEILNMSSIDAFHSWTQVSSSCTIYSET